VPRAWLRAAASALVRLRFPRVPRTTVEALRERLAAGPGGPLLLDARTADEYAVSHLAGADHTPEPEGARTAIARARQADPARDVIVYCSIGWRSAALVDRLARDGVPNVANLEGSLFAWASRGLPLEDHEGPTLCVHPYDALWGLLLDPDLRARHPR